MPTVSERRESIQAYLRDSAETKRRAAEACTDAIVAAADLIVEAFRTGAKLLLCGNGGSAADCQHMAAEFVSRFTKDFERPGLPAIALTTDSSFLTAYANDCGFDGIFERQVEALGRPGDVLIGISTSGNSPNVIRAVRRARAEGLRSVVAGGSRGQLASLADVAISVPSADTQHIQESHLAIEHLICWLVERELFPSPQTPLPAGRMAMIISRTPFRISFFGGGTDYPDWYRQARRGRTGHDDRQVLLHQLSLPAALLRAPILHRLLEGRALSDDRGDRAPGSSRGAPLSRTSSVVWKSITMRTFPLAVVSDPAPPSQWVCSMPSMR